MTITMSDEAPGDRSNKRTRRVLDWRMDPKRSWSDFAVEVVCVSDDGDKDITVYHVHKNVLVFGDRGSGYFAGLFSSPAEETQSGTVGIALSKPEADTFPLLLDHQYSLDSGVLGLTLENAAALYRLADYLRVDSLCLEIKRFWKTKLNVDNLGACLGLSKTFHVPVLREMVVEHCIVNANDVCFDSPLMDVADSQFWLDACSVVRSSWSDFRPELYELVAEFCVRQKGRLDALAFSELIDSGKVSFLSLTFNSALKLLEVENAVRISGDPDELTTLQKSCVRAMSWTWGRLLESPSTQEFLGKLSPLILSRVMQRSLERAGFENDALGELMGNANGDLLLSIIVAGAGSQAANGTYGRVGNCDSTGPEYRKDGTWGGQLAAFSLCQFSCSSECNYAWSITMHDGRWGDGDGLYCAFSFANEFVRQLPPKGGWEATGSGAEPAPTVTYIFGTEEDA